jgi:hypothetical protein
MGNRILFYVMVLSLVFLGVQSQIAEGGSGTLAADNPEPADGEVGVLTDIDLSWTAGDDSSIEEVLGFDVYVDPNVFKVEAKDGDCRKRLMIRIHQAIISNPRRFITGAWIRSLSWRGIRTRTLCREKSGILKRCPTVPVPMQAAIF